MIRKNRRTARAIRQDIASFVDEIFIPQRFYDPPNRFHVVGHHRFIIVVEIDPAPHARDDPPPLVRIAQHARTARIVEFFDAVSFDFVLGIDAEFFFD